MSDQRRTAVIDRIVDGQHAVLLVDDSYELVVPVDDLPEGVEGGTHIQFDEQDGRLLNVTIDEEARHETRKKVREKLDQLRQRGRRPRK